MYKEIRSLRASISDAVVLAVTATATDAIMAEVEEILGVSDFQKILKLPNR
jgi:superfamily II DNA helicase RecQ